MIRHCQKKDLSNLTGVSYQTISKWDKISINEDVFKEDGYCYFKYIAKTGKTIETNWEEFSNFWKSKKISNRMEQYFKEAKEGKITMDTYNMLVLLTANDKVIEEGVVYYRVQRYKINDKNKLCQTISKLIKNIYGF